MPFQKVGENDFVSPSGRHFTKKQVEMYYVTGGFKKPVEGGGDEDTDPVDGAEPGVKVEQTNTRKAMKRELVKRVRVPHGPLPN